MTRTRLLPVAAAPALMAAIGLVATGSLAGATTNAPSSPEEGSCTSGAAQATRARTRWPRCLYCGEAQLCGWSSCLLESRC